MSRFRLTLFCGLAVLVAGCHAPVRTTAPATPLKIVTWNMEHLAEADGTGCRPRTEADYAAMRRYADQMDADVIAFEEVETAKAAARVFTPDKYHVVFSERPDSGRHGACGGSRDGLTIRKQDVGFAIRNGIPFTRHDDVRELGVGNPDLRWGVDITVEGRQPLRLLGVHLKSGCFKGDQGSACPVLLDQVPVLQKWIGEREKEGAAFVILGDWNRRLDLPGDRVWLDLGRSAPGVNLVDATAGHSATCEAKYPDFIDHLVMNRAASTRMVTGSFNEFTYGVPEAEHPSDHCPVSIMLTR
ncbi:endonuclease/exonuclease/phosphatase family metal-dependent hydrolase [Luteibacter rhizovicinus]|uniref:Endonuclease/exonuclease/phosphatase family metal-dependent hydrolase n=1 Tax=Luteibacter rhizovicinus TaxID=242606 RepID=A0A4R3YNF9_9GAMM|nr:endonuclease/exonuclease/phosphatase family protein [Luteibacter rhizovicinus]TCV93880.1 endonuclease/exonuclease/phosphatase family metal-dependent hydrolase [Luteibacter rhizovicinus]